MDFGQASKAKCGFFRVPRKGSFDVFTLVFLQLFL